MRPRREGEAMEGRVAEEDQNKTAVGPAWIIPQRWVVGREYGDRGGWWDGSMATRTWGYSRLRRFMRVKLMTLGS